MVVQSKEHSAYLLLLNDFGHMGLLGRVEVGKVHDRDL